LLAEHHHHDYNGRKAALIAAFLIKLAKEA
jgi:hypothetical protein